MFVCFTDSLESSSIQAAKDVKAADHNEQVIANLRMQSEFISGVIDSVMFETSVVNIRAVKHHTCKYLVRKRVHVIRICFPPYGPYGISQPNSLDMRKQEVLTQTRCPMKRLGFSHLSCYELNDT